MKMYKVAQSTRDKLNKIQRYFQNTLDINDEFCTLPADTAAEIRKILDHVEEMAFAASYPEVNGRLIKAFKTTIDEYAAVLDSPVPYYA